MGARCTFIVIGASHGLGVEKAVDRVWRLRESDLVEAMFQFSFLLMKQLKLLRAAVATNSIVNSVPLLFGFV